MIVMKFGGTSVKDAPSIKNAVSIIKSKKSKKRVVVSSAAAGITNQLIDLASNALIRTNEDNKEIIEKIKSRHLKIIDELIQNPKEQIIAKSDVNKIISKLNEHIEAIKLLNECTDKSLAYIMSFGEILSTKILTYAINESKQIAAFFDIRTVLTTDDNYLEAEVDLKKSKRKSNKIKKILTENDIIITQGFIASDYVKRTTTLGRGGSDYSAALLASIMRAEEIQIWTDVDGVLSADPRKVKNPVTIKQMSFDEIRELSYYGAKVLHPETIKPAIENDIPVKILNTFNLKGKGTTITSTSKNKKPEIRSVITKNDCIEFKVEIPAGEDSNLFFSDLLKRFENKSVKVLYSLATKNNCRIVINVSSIRNEGLKYIFGPYDSESMKVGLMCISGINLNKFTKTKNFTELMEALTDINISNLLCGISEYSILSLYPIDKEKKILNITHKIITKR